MLAGNLQDMGEIMRDSGAWKGICETLPDANLRAPASQPGSTSGDDSRMPSRNMGTGHDTDALGNYRQVPGYSWRR